MEAAEEKFAMIRVNEKHSQLFERSHEIRFYGKVSYFLVFCSLSQLFSYF